MQTKEEYIEKVDKLIQPIIEPILDNDHYLHLMPDDFIIDAVVNPLGWTKEEHLLAKEILKQRNVSPWKI